MLCRSFYMRKACYFINKMALFSKYFTQLSEAKAYRSLKIMILKVEDRTFLFVLLLRKWTSAVAEASPTDSFLFPFYLSKAVSTLYRSDLRKHHQAFANSNSNAFTQGVRCWFGSSLSFPPSKHRAKEIISAPTFIPLQPLTVTQEKKVICFNTEGLSTKCSIHLPTYFLIIFKSSAKNIKCFDIP